MCHPSWPFVLLLLLFPSTSSAIQIRWSTGADTLTLTAATRCTLVVEAAAAGRLPAEWRLLWVADSASIQFVAMDSLEACLLDDAQASRIEGPATAADSAANLSRAYFCSDAGSPATVARQVLDLPAGGRGKLKAVALDPGDPDSSRVLESNEVTYNGGIAGSYPPVILHASSVHQSLQLRVTAVGSGLSTVNSMNIAALDSSWTLPLTVTARGDASLTGVASVAALLPACQTTVGSESGAVSAGALAADEEPPLDPQSCSAQFWEELLSPPPPLREYTIQPKDFAFARGFVDSTSNRYALHLFYIRHNYWYDEDPRQPDLNEKNIGHTWTTDFNTWHPNPTDTMALTVRPTKFDDLHVWAPTIVQYGPTFYMFYTGVRKEDGRNHQRIGLATSTDLNTWTPADDPVFTSPQVPWASKNPPTYDGQQLRDPFVMADPVNPGQWLMYFVAVDSLRYPQMAVGVARSLGDFSVWAADEVPLRGTQKPTFLGTTFAVESPHVFRRNGRWWLPYSVNQYNVFFETTASADPTDTTVVNWTDPVFFRDAAEGNPAPLQWWHATEYLRIGATEYLAAWNDNAISIDIKGVFAPANASVDSFLLTCPQHRRHLPPGGTRGRGEAGRLIPAVRCPRGGPAARAAIAPVGAARRV